MAWTAPRTWVTGETVTAALLNAQVRDNLLETSAATVTTAGDLAYADGTNSMGSRVAIGAAHGMLVSTGSVPVWRVPATDVDTASKAVNGLAADETVYTTLGTLADPFASEVEVTVTSGTFALVLFKATLSNDTAGSITQLSYSVSGASTIAANNERSIFYESSNANDRSDFAGFDLVTVTAGSNTFTLEARVDADTGTVARPEIAVLPL